MDNPHQSPEDKGTSSLSLDPKERLEQQETERKAYWDSLTRSEKEHFLAVRYFNRHGEPEWEDHNSLYEENEGFSDFITDDN